MSDHHASQKKEGDINAYASILLGSPYHFSPAASGDPGTPKLATKEWQIRKCQVYSDGSGNDPPWICVAACIDEDTLPVGGETVTLYHDIKGTSDWKCDDGRGDIVTVYFWRKKLPKGKKGPWNYFWDTRVSYHNQPPAPGHIETPAQDGGEARDLFDLLGGPRIDRFDRSLP